MSFELAYCQPLIGGLYSADPIHVPINFRIISHGFLRHLGWGICIRATIDGHVAKYGMGYSGDDCDEDDFMLEFSGAMPLGKDLKGKITFSGFYYLYTPWSRTFDPDKIYDDVQFAERNITIKNLDDMPPETPTNGEPPVVCPEGQERCVGYDREICQNSEWKVKEYNSPECGYTPEPLCTNGEDRCVGTDYQVCVGDHWEIRERNSPMCGYVPPDEGEPTPPDEEGEGIGGWIDRNKTAIIIGSVAVLVISIIVLATKTRVQFPVAAWPRFQPPVVRK